MRGATLGDVFERITNGKNVRQNETDGGIRITRIETISMGIVDPTRVGYAGLEHSDNEKWILRDGDILMSHINSPVHVGKCALYTNDLPEMVHGMNLLRLEPNKSLVDSSYAVRYFRTPAFRAQLRKFINQAVNQASISVKNLKSIEIALPQLEEQRRIAGILDKADALRGKRRKAIAHLDVLGQSIFHEMFAGLSGDALTLRDASLRFVSGRNMVGTGVNAHPTKKVLKVNAASSGEFDGSQVKPLPMNYDPPAAHRVEVGDLIVTRASGTKDLIGVATLVDSVPSETYLPDKLWKAVVNPRLLLAEYFRFLTRSTTYRKYVSNAASGAAGVSNISQAKLLDFQLVLPPIESQQAFADRMAAIESLKMTYRAQLADLDALFLSLQDRAFKGEL
ncbi:MAG TPA: restriction endonuclease subunit S [Glutamicibacter sp.]|uniref:Type I restriction-modification system specificity subunit n=1 Tax=Glutamicibacter arilaitensis (strain DSM 16368 / CIP 108037 / IAM 15318 / JCM 13566 / NCIMB 14258 / Re117) TaxID=861360 RepID=A0ABM9Q1F6_GLUAR|nr:MULTISPECIES: restriction endonuclease subunit S [Glutamicibacter]CBT77526.1 type I restriction-modification system specificity subunit [Glutamicibacter arilaitensis Re117]HCH46820.1 restriction endonuclease subunit S [Glutamicibacter sp.]